MKDTQKVAAETHSVALKDKLIFLDYLLPFAITGGIMITLATAFRPLALYWWIAELSCNFVVQYALLLIPILTLVILRRQKIFAMIFAGALAVNLWLILPYLPWQRPDPDPKTGIYRLMIQNVMTGNHQYQQLINLVSEENPDILLLFEIDSDWMDSLDGLHENYPFREFDTYSGNFGIAIFARYEWNSCEIKQVGPHQLPTVVAKWGDERSWGGTLGLVGTHPLPPLGRQRSLARNEHLVESHRQLSLLHAENRILAGDFNLSPWSPWFRKIERGYVDAARGFSAGATWHIFPTLLGGVKIDHVLVDVDYGVNNYRIGPDIGSDHRAVLVDIRGWIPK